MTAVPEGIVHVDFPQCPEAPAREARVVQGGWFPERPGGDLAMLEVLGEGPLGVSPAPLRLAGESRNRVFVLGHPAGQDMGVWARAKLMARGGPQGEWVQMDALRSVGKRIQKGFSGAGVWDDSIEAVIGCVVAEDRTEQDRVAWMIPVEVICRYWPDLRGVLRHEPVTPRRPALARDTSLMAAADRDRLAAMLFGLRGISETASRALVVDALESRFAGRLHVERQDNGLLDTLAIIDACLEHPGALHELIAMLRAYHTTDAEERRLVAEISDIAETVDPAPLLNHAERNKLYRLLDAMAEITVDTVLSSYREAAGLLSTRSIDPFDLQQVVRILESAMSGPDGLPPLLIFLEGLSRRLQSPATAELRDWVDLFAAREGIPSHLISRIRISSPPASTATPATGYLLTELYPDGADDMRYLSRITLLHGDRSDRPAGYVLHDGRTPLTIGEIPSLFDDVLSGMWDATSIDMDELVIEFLLPFGLLGHAVDQWEVQADVMAHPVCVEHLVLVRYRNRPRRSHGKWRQRTRRLREGNTTIRWADPNDASDVSGNLFRDLANSLTPCLALLRPPRLAGELGNDAVSIGIWTGVPVMVWCRDDASTDAFVAQLTSYLSQNSLADLPALVQQLRTGTFGLAEPPGAHITLIWDLQDEPTAPVVRLQAPI
jgi:hypothetical protein